MLGRHDSSEVKYPDNRVLETPHRIASRMFSAFLDQRVVHVFQPAVKMSALEALFKPLRGHTLQGVSSSREKPFLQPEEKVLVACSILCTSAECALSATIAFCVGFINVFYPKLPPIPLLLVCPASLLARFCPAYLSNIICVFFPSGRANTSCLYSHPITEPHLKLSLETCLQQKNILSRYQA